MPNAELISLADLRPKTILVGAGVVGQAIAQAHLDASVSFCLADQSQEALLDTIDQLAFSRSDWVVTPPGRLDSDLSVVQLICIVSDLDPPSVLVIESIAERLDVKQSFFSKAEHLFGGNAILCTNTSTLRISGIAEPLQRPERFCGMHFFMPVDKRPAVELVRGTRTSESTIALASQHIRRVNKEPLVVRDGPGFVVNRLLSPYLNTAMLLLSDGVSAERIERAALSYGMPMSPLELIDWIGTRTVFDAGRVFWQAFPDRIDPSPLAPALLKRKRFGRSSGAGFFDYVDGIRSELLSPSVVRLAKTYCREQKNCDDDAVLRLLTIPMWTEAALACQDGIVNAAEQFEVAMRGGLGFDNDRSWCEFFDSMGSDAILATAKEWGAQIRSIKIPDATSQLLSKTSPTNVLVSLAE